MSTKPDSDIRAAILRRLEELGQNRLWLVNESGIGKAHLYGYLARKVDMAGEKIEILLKVLGLAVVPASSSPPRGKKLPKPPDMPV